MKVGNLLRLTGFFGVLFGLGYLFFPRQILAFYAVELDANGLFVARFFGGAILGYGILAWEARNVEGSKTRKAIKLGLFLSFLVGTILAIIGCLNGFFNVWGWPSAAVFALLTLGFGYLRFINPSDT